MTCNLIFLHITPQAITWRSACDSLRSESCVSIINVANHCSCLLRVSDILRLSFVSKLKEFGSKQQVKIYIVNSLHNNFKFHLDSRLVILNNRSAAREDLKFYLNDVNGLDETYTFLYYITQLFVCSAEYSDYYVHTFPMERDQENRCILNRLIIENYLF